MSGHITLPSRASRASRASRTPVRRKPRVVPYHVLMVCNLASRPSFLRFRGPHDIRDYAVYLRKMVA
jgi:hypothetical protein